MSAYSTFIRSRPRMSVYTLRRRFFISHEQAEKIIYGAVKYGRLVDREGDSWRVRDYKKPPRTPYI